MPIHSLSDLKREDEAKGAGAGAGAGAMAGPVDGEKLSKDFMGMYHEKQIGGLCAVHCMNNLVQGPEFDEIELSEVAQDMDRREREALGSALSGESGNVRLDGFFSVQVISEALQKRGLSCIPIGSTEAAGGKHPREFHASVCVQTRRGARSPSFHMDVHILTGRHSR
eukprot:Tamp_10263.p1 GENE.Tamp_10263~~Tamp_10263.p1  ORF type:complete len:168 (+),score=41.00 Tamp_10263:126-629(+)